jgi:hypothetical protein
VLGKITMVFMTAAALTAGLTANAFAFSGGVSHVVMHPVAMTTGIVTAMPADPPTAIRLSDVPQYHARYRGRATSDTTPATHGLSR